MRVQSELYSRESLFRLVHRRSLYALIHFRHRIEAPAWRRGFFVPAA